MFNCKILRAKAVLGLLILSAVAVVATVLAQCLSTATQPPRDTMMALCAELLYEPGSFNAKAWQTSQSKNLLENRRRCQRWHDGE